MGGEESTPWGQQGAQSVESLGGLRGAKNEDPEGVLTRQEWYTYFRKLNLVTLLLLISKDLSAKMLLKVAKPKNII